MATAMEPAAHLPTVLAAPPLFAWSPAILTSRVACACASASPSSAALPLYAKLRASSHPRGLATALTAPTPPPAARTDVAGSATPVATPPPHPTFPSRRLT